MAYAPGAGHPDRDSYASLVRWNAPETLVERDGQLFLRRDFLLGIAFPDYGRYVRHVFPGPLEADRATLEADMRRTPIPQVVLRELRLDADGLAGLTDGQLRCSPRTPLSAACTCG